MSINKRTINRNLHLFKTKKLSSILKKGKISMFLLNEIILIRVQSIKTQISSYLANKPNASFNYSSKNEGCG